MRSSNKKSILILKITIFLIYFNYFIFLFFSEYFIEIKHEITCNNIAFDIIDFKFSVINVYF